MLGVLPVSLALVLMTPSTVLGQADGERLALSLRNNVVSIIADRPGGERHGFGIIVGERGGRVYIATANHVVRGSEPKDLSSRVRVRYYQRRDEEYAAVLLGTSDARYDIAVIEAMPPPGLEWYRESVRARAEAARGTDVWFIGRGGAWYIPTQPGRLNRVTLDFRIDVDDLNVQVGSSGAPLLSADGMLGILLVDETAGSSSALSIEMIERAIRLWDLPWDLKPLTARAAIPSLSTEVAMHLSAGDRFLQVGQFDRAVEEFQNARKYDARNAAVLLRVVRAMRLSLWQQVGIPFDELLPNASNEAAASADRALQVLYQAQGIDPLLQTDTQWLLEEARIRRGRGDFHLARQVLEKSRLAAPDDPDVMSEMGLLLARIAFDGVGGIPRDQHASGIELLRRAVAIRPDDAILRRHLAYALELSDPEAAVSEFDKVVSLPTRGDGVLEQNRRGAIVALNARLANFGLLQRRPWEGSLPAADVVRISEYVRAAPNFLRGGSSEWRDWSIWTGLLQARAYYELGNFTAAERLCWELVGRKPEEILGERFGYREETQFLVLLGRVLERSGSDPAMLLAVRLHVGKPNSVGAFLSNEARGVRVYALTAGGLAQEAGLAIDDEILGVDGQETPDVVTFARALARRKPGERIELRVNRNDKPILMAATIPESRPSGARLGAFLVNEDDPRARDEVRVVVTKVEENSPAARAGITAGDAILSLNDVPLSGVDHLLYLLSGFRAGAVVQVEIERSNRTLELEATLAAADPAPSK